MLEFDPDVSTVYDPVIVVIFNLYAFAENKDAVTTPRSTFALVAMVSAKNEYEDVVESPDKEYDEVTAYDAEIVTPAFNAQLLVTLYVDPDISVVAPDADSA